MGKNKIMAFGDMFLVRQDHHIFGFICYLLWMWNLERCRDCPNGLVEED